MKHLKETANVTVRKKLGEIMRSLRFQAWFFRILLILCLLPLVWISFYAHAGADDFAFSNYPHHAWEETHTLAAFFGGCMKQFHWNYFSWQGCYSAVILGTLDPLAFGEQYYCLVPMILMGLLVFSNFVWWRTFVRHASGSRDNRNNRDLSDILASLSCIMEMQLLPRAFDMFFWWDGAVNYLPFFAFLLLMGAILARLYDDGRLPAWLIAAGMFLSFVFVGGNYSTALVNLLSILFFGILIGFERYGKHWDMQGWHGISMWLPYLLILAAACVGLAVSVLAPGNAARVEEEGAAGITQIPEAILMSLRLAVDSVQDNMSVLLFLLLVLTVPFLWKICPDAKDQGHPSYTKCPLVLIWIGLFCIYAASFAPSVYVYGDGGPVRLEDVRFFYYVFFLLVGEAVTVWRARNFFAMRQEMTDRTGIAHKEEPEKQETAEKKEEPEKQEIADKTGTEHGYGTLPAVQNAGEKLSGVTMRYLTGVLTLAVLITAVYYVIPRDNRERLTSICAARSLLIGEAQEYDREMKAREAILNDPSTDGQDVIVPAVTVRPKLLFLLGLEMETDPGNWINQTVAAYYDKKSVTLDDSNLQ